MSNIDKNIRQYDNKGQKHGYWEVYWSNGNLCYKGFYQNGKLVGYEEYYDMYLKCKLTRKKYNI